MNRSTPGKLARAERLERQSPYARPDSKVKRSTSMISFPGLRSLVSYVTYPFSRSPTTKGLPMTTADIAIDQKSESGSEDEWNGGPSEEMQGRDVFDLASAGGRDGAEFDTRAEKWRARGEVVGGRRQTARRSLEAAIVEPPLKSPIMPGHMPSSLLTSPTTQTAANGHSAPMFGAAPTSFGSAIGSMTSTLKRRLSPTKPPRALPIRSPIPAFAPVPPPITPAAPSRAAGQSSTSALASTSASSVALKAFLDAKDGQPLSTEDLRVIESLTESARHESEAGSVRRELTTLGGWAAGSFTPRPIRPMPGTPGRQAPEYAGSGSAFNMGISPARPSTPGRVDSPGSVRYIGPGWSARRLHPQRKSGLKPLFSVNAEEDGGTPKKRRTEIVEAMDEDIPPVPALPTLASSMSMPNLAGSSRNIKSATPKQKEKQKEISPIKSTRIPTPTDPVSLGKKRAADIMLDLINSEIGEELVEKKHQPFIVNPYHPDARTLVSASTPSSKPPAPTTPALPHRNGTPRKSILKSSVNNQTPLRGAAKRLEESKAVAPSPGKGKMSALEMLTGRSGKGSDLDKGKAKAPAQEGDRRGRRMETPDTEPEEPSEVEEMIESPTRGRSRSRSRSPLPPTKGTQEDSAARPKRTRIEEPEHVSPLPAPQLSGGSLPLPTPSKSSTTSYASSGPQVAFQPARAPSAPKFIPSPLSKPFVPEEPVFSVGRSDTPSTSSRKANDLSALYLSAKDTALAIAKDALPFFTFAFTAPKISDLDKSESVKRAKEEALKRPIEKFTFTLIPPTPAPARTITSATSSNPLASIAKPSGNNNSTGSGSGGKWKCSLCMLDNDASATEKCMVCDEPRPGVKAAAPAMAAPTPAPPVTTSLGTSAQAANTGFNWAAAGVSKPSSKPAGTWMCGTCGLSNPDSAKEKCQVCEALR